MIRMEAEGVKVEVRAGDAVGNDLWNSTNPKRAAPKAGQVWRTDGHCRRRMGFMDDVGRSVERIRAPRTRNLRAPRPPGAGAGDEGAFVVIDVESGDYAIVADEEEAFARVGARHQGGMFFFSRIGPGGEAAPAHRIGAHH